MRLMSRDATTGKSVIELDCDDVALILRRPESPDQKPGIEIILPIPDPTALVPSYVCALANVARRFNNVANSIITEANDYRAWVIGRRRTFSRSAFDANREITEVEMKKLNQEFPL